MTSTEVAIRMVDLSRTKSAVPAVILVFLAGEDDINGQTVIRTAIILNTLLDPLKLPLV